MVTPTWDALVSITAGLGVSELSQLSKVYRCKARCLAVLNRLDSFIDRTRSEHPLLADQLTRARMRVHKRLDTYTTIFTTHRRLATAELAAEYFDVPVEVFRKPARAGAYARTFRAVGRASYRKTAGSDFTFRAMCAMDSCRDWYPFLVTLTNSPAHPRVFDTGEECPISSTVSAVPSVLPIQNKPHPPTIISPSGFSNVDREAAGSTFTLSSSPAGYPASGAMIQPGIVSTTAASSRPCASSGRSDTQPSSPSARHALTHGSV